MSEHHPLEKLISDVVAKYRLSAEREHDLHRRLIASIFSGKLPARDKFGELVDTPVTISSGGNTVFVDKTDVNDLFIEWSLLYEWRPRKKLGAPVKENALDTFLRSGQLEIDAQAAATRMCKRGDFLSKDRVATELTGPGAAYAKCKHSSVFRKIKASWWKELKQGN